MHCFFWASSEVTSYHNLFPIQNCCIELNSRGLLSKKIKPFNIQLFKREKAAVSSVDLSSGVITKDLENY